ncbi:transposon Tf2-8 polyprotein [Trichonephila clavipes]|nr:transposon Tf2-8 polyprotein [Trichonephila clavipes]
MIDLITTYYGNAIRQNKTCLADMRKAVWAVYFHIRSSDEEPLHSFCPVGPNSWCKYQNQVVESSVETFRHSNKLPVAVMDAIKPVFNDLSQPKLLQKCLGGKTNNNNESINSLIWKLCPKTLGCGRKIVDISTNEAIVIFNDGNQGRLKIMQSLGLTVGQFAHKFVKLVDIKRIQNAEVCVYILISAQKNSYGLKLNISKCVFGVTELIFLGHLITPDGIKPLPDKVQAVLDYKQPETVGSLRKLLGLLNFYRCFLPKAAEQQYLLSEFLKGSKGKKDSKPLNWSSEAITAFQRCKQALADAALLAHPSPSAPLALHVDASDYAIKGALHQVVESELQPLAFFSRKLTSPEKSYSAYDRELLAIYSAIRHFRYMLEARDFTVFTDHKPLTYAFRQKSDKCSPRQIRQLNFISQFTTNIVHIPGSDNIAADVLSRVSAFTFPSQIDYDCIAETQQTDQELNTLIASGTSLELKKVTFPNSSTEIMCDLSTGTARPYIPKQHRQDVFSAMHNLSHPGIRRSVHLMKQRFVWPSISSDVAKWARHCLACQKSKIHRHTRSPLSSFQEPSQRFDHVHLDLIGPLPPSNGYTYCLTMIDRFSKWPES